MQQREMKRLEPGSPAPGVALPPGWKIYYSPKHGGRPYYGNKQTGQTQWELPVAPAGELGAVAAGNVIAQQRTPAIIPGDRAHHLARAGALLQDLGGNTEGKRGQDIVHVPPQRRPPLQNADQRRPASRHGVSQARLAARDRWNTDEIRIQDLFRRYDHDGSGHLEQEEFRELLREFNNNRWPTDQEFGFMMRICDKDHDGRISFNELHYAVRAWHSYLNLDESVLKLFAEFDTDCSGRLDIMELQALLTQINDGRMVPLVEVQQILEHADLLGDGQISRSELLGAIAAWYTHVDRKDTDIASLVREALARTVAEHDQLGTLTSSGRSFAMAASYVKGSSDYAQVAEASEEKPSLDDLRSWGFRIPVDVGDDAEGGGQTFKKRFVTALPAINKSCLALTYVASPVVINVLLLFVGWMTRENECPRNLDGILFWFGLLGLCFIVLGYIHAMPKQLLLADCQADAATGFVMLRLALGVVLVVLNIVGLIWSSGEDVSNNKHLCGHFLVYFSKTMWIVIPIIITGFGCYSICSHLRRLQKGDEHIQESKEIIL